MLLNLLTSSLPQGYREASIPEAALYALIGFVVVFLGIAFLVFTVWLVGYLIKKVKPATHVQTSIAVKDLNKEDGEIEEETIAVITAALMAFYQTNNPKCEFTVKRIKRVRRDDYA